MFFVVTENENHENVLFWNTVIPQSVSEPKHVGSSLWLPKVAFWYPIKQKATPSWCSSFLQSFFIEFFLSMDNPCATFLLKSTPKRYIWKSKHEIVEPIYGIQQAVTFLFVPSYPTRTNQAAGPQKCNPE